ncbi:MAG: DUF1295 domain-containing protein [Pseudomonadota bacterium]
MTFELIVLPWLIAVAFFSLIWPFSVLRKDASMVDLAWGPGFLLQFAVAYGLSADGGQRPEILLVLIAVWSARLGATLVRRRFADGYEDPRYTLLRESWGTGFWWKSLFIVFILQSFIQWLIIVGPITALAAPSSPLGVIGWIGCAMAAGGLVIETVADLQLDAFRRQQQRGALMTTGLRAIVRYPHYFGEIVFWIGIAVVCAEGGAWLGVLSPILITLFLLKVSGIPLLEEHLAATRPEFPAYRARVPALLPSLKVLRAQ